jgi:hypothetical protein
MYTRDFQGQGYSNKNRKNPFATMQALIVPTMLQPQAVAREQAPSPALRPHHRPPGLPSLQKQKHRLFKPKKPTAISLPTSAIRHLTSDVANGFLAKRGFCLGDT